MQMSQELMEILFQSPNFLCENEGRDENVDAWEREGKIAIRHWERVNRLAKFGVITSEH